MHYAVCYTVLRGVRRRRRRLSSVMLCIVAKRYVLHRAKVTIESL